MNRVAFVTGASRGIGRATAAALAAQGFDIVAAATQIETNDEVGAELAAAGAARTLRVNLNLASQESIKEAFGRALAEFGRIDVLVNNAGVTKDGLAVRMKPDDWQRVLQVNLTGAFFAIQQVLPGMMKERWGRIINISSVVGKSGNPGQANYVSSKAGLIGLTKSLAQELGSRNITVNAVAPGYIETDMTAVLTPEQKERMLAAIPLKRMGRGEDVAAAVCFLAGEGAAYITGQVIDVNGGLYM